MHARAMLLLKKKQSSSIVDYVPIAKCLAQASMDPSTREKTKKKFDIAYMMAKEKLAFAKMKCICELEERHGVDLAGGYKNDHACSTFTSYIAREQQEILLGEIENDRLNSVLSGHFDSPMTDCNFEHCVTI